MSPDIDQHRRESFLELSQACRLSNAMPSGYGGQSASPLFLSPKEQFDRYVDALFPDETLTDRFAEVRAIDTWTESGKKKSLVLDHLWLAAGELKESYETLRALNSQANIFVGVNPRIRTQGTKEAVREAYCLSADVDYQTPAAVASACLKIGLPEPTILVDSGHGCHVYYFFERPHRFNTERDRTLFEEAGRGFHRAIGADCTHDISRLLRIPGFANVKDLRNGTAPRPCTLVYCDSSRRFPASLFLDRWHPELKPSRPIALDTHYLPDARTERRIRGLVHYLANDQVGDRSRRDFGVLMGLLRLGLSPEQIWQLVQDHSKFATNGERYFRTTIANAERALEGQSFFE